MSVWPHEHHDSAEPRWGHHLPSEAHASPCEKLVKIKMVGASSQGVRWADGKGAVVTQWQVGRVPLSDWACVLGTEPEVEG